MFSTRLAFDAGSHVFLCAVCVCLCFVIVDDRDIIFRLVSGLVNSSYFNYYYHHEPSYN